MSSNLTLSQAVNQCRGTGGSVASGENTGARCGKRFVHRDIAALIKHNAVIVAEHFLIKTLTDCGNEVCAFNDRIRAFDFNEFAAARARHLFFAHLGDLEPRDFAIRGQDFLLNREEVENNAFFLSGHHFFVVRGHPFFGATIDNVNFAVRQPRGRTRAVHSDVAAPHHDHVARELKGLVACHGAFNFLQEVDAVKVAF